MMEKLPFVLLVDDDEAANYAHDRLLRQLGVAHEIRTAGDGQEALALLKQHPPFEPTLLLLDVNMPELDGIDFLRAFQQLPAAQQAATRVVMLTLYMSSQQLALVNELPISGLVSKPLTREKIDMLLQIHFNRQLPSVQDQNGGN